MQVLGLVQVPQLATVRVAPQLSSAVTLPQLLVLRAQKAMSVSRVQLHTPAALQVAAPVQVPQLTVRARPQRSVRVLTPHERPAAVHSWASLSGWHTHWPEVPQACVDEQLPHMTCRLAPQRSMTALEPQVVWPQSCESGSGWQTHWPAALQACAAPQVPHVSCRRVPQRSMTDLGPQVVCPQSWASVSGWQVHWPAWQVWVVAQLPHETWRWAPHRSTTCMSPQTAPRHSSVSVSAMQPASVGVSSEMHRPAHCWLPTQTSHEFPSEPQAVGSAPPTHAPVASQQPPQVVGPHGRSVGPQAVRANTVNRAQTRRSMPREWGAAGCFLKVHENGAQSPLVSAGLPRLVCYAPGPRPALKLTREQAPSGPAAAPRGADERAPCRVRRGQPRGSLRRIESHRLRHRRALQRADQTGFAQRPRQEEVVPRPLARRYSLS